MRIAARLLPLLAVALVALGAEATRAQSPDLPIFDTHIHYSAPDWVEYPPERILGILEKAGIRRALVSSTPDDGTLTLHARDPKRIVPILRPYRTRGRHGPLVAGRRGARLRAGAPAEEPRRAQGHRRVPPLRRADRHLRGQAHHRDRGAGEHLSPRPLGRARDHRAVHDRAAPPGDLGPRGHVLGSAGGGRPARPLPEPVGGPGHPQQRRGPGRHARPGLARGVPPPPGSLPRRAPIPG